MEAVSLYPGVGAEWNIKNIKKEIQSEDWEDDPDDPHQQVRRLYVGPLLGCTPSGKFYTPFACSNVEPCPSCKGKGHVPRFKRRVVKKRAAKQERERPQMYGGRRKLLVFTHRERREARHKKWLRIYHNYADSTYTCTACGGIGSREAYLDQRWQEYSVALFNEAGLSFEGDGNDYFAVECRQKEEDDNDDT